MPAVHVGDGSIIGANSVVAKDILPYSVAVGNSARIIRKRFDDEKIELLEKLKWWDKTPNQMQRNIPLLPNNDINYVKKDIKNILDKSNYKEKTFKSLIDAKLYYEILIVIAVRPFLFT